jgi:class 3 adenylate cyclase
VAGSSGTPLNGASIRARISTALSNPFASASFFRYAHEPVSQLTATTAAGAWLESASGQQTPILGSCSLGRAAGSTLVLGDDKVSRRHLMIHAQGEGEFWLIDLGSANGTYLNGRRVISPCRLNDQDRIEVGGHRFTFRQQQTAQIINPEAGTERTIHDIRSMTCWLLVADIEQYTQFLQKVPADEVSRVTGRWLAGCKQIVEENQGSINKFLGDGFFAYWPANDGASAPAVAKTFQALKELQAKEAPRFRLVLHYGRVFAGGGSINEESLMGPEVNFVFRVEKVASHLGLPRLISEPAHAQIKTLLPTTEEGRHAVPSFDGEHLFFTC